MSMTQDQILSEAMSLAPAERERLAERLLLSLGEADQAEVEAAWLAEAERRAGQIERGEVTGRSAEEVVEQLRQKARRP